MTRTLVALALGIAAYFITEQIVIGIVGAALGFWLLPQLSKRRGSYEQPTPVLPVPPRNARTDGIEVVCKQVTPLRQEWVSVKTGRLYDVLSGSGLPGARPGDHGQASVEGSGYRIRRLSEPD